LTIAVLLSGFSGLSDRIEMSPGHESVSDVVSLRASSPLGEFRRGGFGAYSTAEEALDGVGGGVSAGAVELDGGVGGGRGGFGGEEFGGGEVARRLGAGGAAKSQTVDESARGEERDRHVGDPLLHHLKLRDRSPELFAGAGELEARL
jgi:hypothetical protein